MTDLRSSSQAFPATPAAITPPPSTKFLCPAFITTLVTLALCLPGVAAAISSRTLYRATGEAAGSYFGVSVANAGDVNGDGYPDQIVGAYLYGSNNGRVYIYFGGPGADSIPDVILSGEPIAEAGYSVAAAGDVNGDGYADVIVGGPFYSGLTGRAYIFFGGPSLVSKNVSAADVILTGESLNPQFGVSVAGAGDVNGDGYADVIVGSNLYGSNQGRAYVFYGGSTLTSKNAAAASVILTGQGGFDYFGTSVSGVGDLNGDGRPDIIVGAPGYSAGNYTGRAYIFYGGATLVSKNAASADVILTGETTSTSFGASVSGGEDVSGDGRPDVIVGASGLFSSTGRAYVFYGGPSLFSKNAGAADVLLTGEANSSYFGVSVSRCGDVNGDGVADLIVGASGYASNTGRAYVFFGGGFLYTKGAQSADVMLTGAAGDNFGGAVAGAGDVDGDGHADVIVGATGYAANTGRTYLTLIYPYEVVSPNGGEQWVRGQPATIRWRGHDLADVSYSSDGGVTYSTIVVGVGGLELNELFVTAPATTTLGRVRVNYSSQFVNRVSSDASDGVFRIVEPMRAPAAANRLGLTLAGLAAGNQLGESMASAGDVNGDGYPDVIVGEPLNDAAGTDAGRAYVYFGGPGADAVPDLTLTGEAALDNFGWSVAGAGDVNGDGYADVIVGSPWHAGSTGRAYVFFGGPSPDAVADIVMNGEAANDFFGYSVAGAGDVNGDGYADMIVGAHGHDVGVTDVGRAYIFNGGPAPDGIADLRLQGEAGLNDFGFSVAGAGDVNGDGYADVIVGAPGYGATAGRAYVYFGGAIGDASPDLTFSGKAVGDNLGWQVAGAGDVDGDGYADVIVGAPGPDTPGSTAGHAYVFLGGRGADSAADMTITGEVSQDLFGNAVAGAGDVNGDGYADLIVGAPHNDAAGTNAGRAYLYYGGPGADAMADVVLTGTTTGDNFGITVGSARDLNGDHFGDVFVSANLSGAAGADAGRAYLYDFKRYQILSPNGGETWNVGATKTISWLGAEPAEVELSVDGGNTYTPLVPNAVGGSVTNSVSIRVPHSPTKFAKIELIPADSKVGGFDWSDSTFTIQTSVSLLALLAAPAPNRGSGALVTWSTDPGPADLAGYRLDRASGGADWTTVAPLTRETSYADPTAGPATRYRLFAVNGLGEELLLGETSFRPAASLSAWPLPYRSGNLSISFATHGGLGGGTARAEVSLYDVSGRVVRTVARGQYAAGYQSVVWDGRDAQGRKAATGVYFLHVSDEGTSRTMKFVVVR